MKLLLLPGFGEDERIFHPIQPHLSHLEHVYIDYRPVLKKCSLWRFNFETFIRELIEYYDVQSTDILLGHSIGGYIAYNISQLIPCKTILVASFTDSSRVKRLNHYYKLANCYIYLTGLRSRTFQRFNHKIHGKSEGFPYFKMVLENFKNYYSRADLVKLHIVSYSPPIDTKRPPDLRFHSKIDNIVRPPKTDFIETEGDHFNIAEYPKMIANQIKNMD